MCHYWARNIWKQVNRTLVQFCKHKPIRRVRRQTCHYRAQNIWRKVTRLWCNSASTNQLEESGDWCATTEHETFESKSQDFGAICEHKPIRRVGRLMCHHWARNIGSKSIGLWCKSASTDQLQESRRYDVRKDKKYLKIPGNLENTLT